MKVMKYLLSLFAVVVLMSCQTQKSASNYSKIEYETTPCFGFCSVFKMTINPDRTAVFEAERFNFEEGHSKDAFSKPREGTFKTTIKAEDYAKLVRMLDRLNAKSLNDKYGNYNITDLPTSFLRLNYKDGSSKNIEDYGKDGTKELAEVYKFIADLRKNQNWKKVE